jgi:large subunit ribosomal protein L24
MKLKKGDNVIVVRGKDKGKTGVVEKISTTTNRWGTEVTQVLIKGVNIVKRAQKPNPQFGITGGMIAKEKPVDISNVMLIDPKTNKPTRVGFKMDGEKKVRFAKKSGEIIK